MERKARDQWETKTKNGKNAEEKMESNNRRKVVYTGCKPNRWDY
jgi:hypothetical protein